MSCENGSAAYHSNGYSHKNYTSVSCDMLLPNVFVQIPTSNANLMPSRSFGTTTVARQDEIKAELPIKSEIDNTNNQQQQPTIASRFTKERTIAQSQLKTTLNKFSSASECNRLNLSAKLVTARPKVKCFKCERCPFMSISQDGYDNHMQSVHSNDQDGIESVNRNFRNKIMCPGCDNVFYSKMSLKIHLVNDHQMSRSDISLLLQSLFAKKSGSGTPKKTASVEKQKIYLKNVEVLQNPKFTSCQYTVVGNTNAPTTPSPLIECQSECSSNLIDDIVCNDDNSNGDLNFNRIQVHATFNQLDSSGLCQQIADIEPTFPLRSLPIDSCSDLDNNSGSGTTSETISSLAIAITDDNPMMIRPDSGSSIKYSENLSSTDNSWSTITMDSNNTHFQAYQSDFNSNATLPTIKIATNSCATPSVSPMPSISSVCHNEKKKIYIKNIDILKEPLIKPTPAANVMDPTCRKNTLHLRTVDEVNLMVINKNESNIYNSTDDNNITLNEDDYRYVLNDTVDYNNIIPQYLGNDVNDLVSNFSDEPLLTTTNTTEYMQNFSSGNTNYSLTNLETAPVENCMDAGNVIALDSTVDECIFGANQYDQRICINNSNIGGTSNANQLLMPTYESIRAQNSDLFALNCENADGNGQILNYLNHDDNENHYFASKFMHTKMLENPDFMIVSTEGIIDTADDILDLTHDEVEQIFDDNLISAQVFDGLSSLKPPQTAVNRMPRINIAANLTKTSSEMPLEQFDKIDMRPLETPTIDLDLLPNNEPVATTAKKKSGRTKGARQINGIATRNDVITTKCSVNNCGMRFKTEAALSLHEQCHSSNKNEIRCPKCESDIINEAIVVEQARNWNWNTLHTHLWREHNIDMELYSCPHCSFKTPILSRLKNTHMKIHFDSRDFKCDYCPKAFKNARQMKNHRRIHTRPTQPTISQCKYCGQSFYSAKHLKEHYYTHSEADEAKRQPSALQCDICSDTLGSKHALRIHHLKHFHGKRFNCDDCEYKSNDHNAFRRHQMVHNKEVKYKCPHCVFQCIQSTNYKSHILKKHPDAAKELMFMCDKCNFVTVNKRMYEMHSLNHNTRMPPVELE